jgi:hypothetical protein
MTALEIIREIRQLPDEEQQKIRIFLAESLEDGQLPAEEIGDLVQKMIDAKDPAEARRLEDEIVRGFYGNAPHA